MEENNRELDKFFQSRLKKGAELQEDWNTPPASAFSNAMDVIDARNKGKRRFFWLWLLLPVVVGLMLGMFYWNNHQISKLDNKLDAIIESQQTNSELIPKQKDPPEIGAFDTIKDETLETTGNLQKTAALDIQTIPNKREVYQEVDQLGILKNVGNRKRIPDNTVDLFHSKGNGELGKEFGEKDISAHDSSDESDTEKLSYSKTIINLSDTILEVQNSITYIPNIRDTSQSDKKEMATGRKQKIYVLGGSNFSNLVMSSPEDLGTALTEYDRNYTGCQLGIGLIHQLNKRWRLDYSMSFQHINNRSVFNNNFNYQKSAEHIRQGQKVYGAEVYFDSPIGIFAEKLDMEIGNRDIPDNYSMTNISTIENRFGLLSAKLAVGYTFYTNKRLSLLLFGGLSSNFTLSMTQQTNMKIYQDQDMMDEHSFKLESKAPMNTQFMGSLAGIGMEYAVGRKMGIGFTGQYERSLQSMKKVDTLLPPIAGQASKTIGVKTHLNSVQTSFKVFYKL